MKIFSLSIILFITLAASFYWFEIRPVQIKHDCSWVKQHSDAIPARPAMTKEELIAKGIIRSCASEIANLKKIMPTSNYELGTNKVYATPLSSIDGKFRAMSDDPLWEATSCIEDGDKVIAEFANPRKAIPARDWYEKADDEEYKFCLRDRGL